ncbi:MAG: GspH/FimT family pseudopilin [bacterium]
MNLIRAHRKDKINSKGFTLIEVVIVLVLLAIVAAIALPSFQRLVVNSPLRTAARDLMAEIALQKERAIAESRQYRIVLDVDNSSYAIQQCQNTGSTCASWSSVLVKNLNRYASDISFDSGSTTVTNYVFQTRGTVTNGTIVLRNNRNSTATIRINISGRTNVQFNLQ